MANEQREAEKQSLLNFLLAHVGRRMGAPLHGVVDTQTNVNSEYGCSQMISSPLSSFHKDTVRLSYLNLKFQNFMLMLYAEIHHGGLGWLCR
jgi:hypothetical protein